MNKHLIKNWLHDFKSYPSEKWFQQKTFVKERYDFFSIFFEKVRMEDFKNEKDFFENEYGFEKMCDSLHSLATNNLALARAKGRKERSYNWKIYLNKLNFLIDKKVKVDIRIDRALKQDKYKIKFFGRSSITELIAYNEAESYSFYI